MTHLNWLLFKLETAIAVHKNWDENSKKNCVTQFWTFSSISFVRKTKKEEGFYLLNVLRNIKSMPDSKKSILLNIFYAKDVNCPVGKFKFCENL